MQLGNHLLLVIPTQNKENSLAFYQKLGFNIVKKNVDNMILSSGKTLFLLHFGNLDKEIKIVFYCPKIALTAARLRFKKIKNSVVKNKQNNFSETSFQIADKFKILLSDDPQYDVPFDNLTDTTDNTAIGNFVEYAFYTKDFETDLLSWQNIGFKRVLYSNCLSTSAILKHKHLQIGLYKSLLKEQDFSFTYHSKNMTVSIDRLEKAGLQWTEKILPNTSDSFNGAKLVSPENNIFWLFKSSVYGMKFVNMPPPSKAYS